MLPAKMCKHARAVEDDAKLDLLSQQDAARDHYVYSQFANPFSKFKPILAHWIANLLSFD